MTVSDPVAEARAMQATDRPIGIVIPVREIDEKLLSVLIQNARSAPAAEFVAVGPLSAAPRDYPDNLRIVNRDCGLYEAMNIGAAAAGADFLLFMGIDDVLFAANVASVARQLVPLSEAALIALPVKIGRRVIRIRPSNRVRVAFHHQGLLMQRRTLLQLGGYSTRYRLHADLDLMFRMQTSQPADWIDTPLVEFRKGGISTSGRNAAASIREFNAIYTAHAVSRVSAGFIISVLYQLWFRGAWLMRNLWSRSSDS